MHPHFKRNLFFLYLRQISAGLLIYQPVFYNFLISRGMSAADFSVLLTAYNLGTLLIVVPAGHFADRIGRKWALMTANTAFTLGTLTLAFGHSLPVFIIGEIIYSLAVALDAGTHSAFLFEFLRSEGKEKEYYKYDAFGMFMFLVAGAIGTLIGGYLAEKGLHIPVITTAFLTAIGIPCAFFLKEPEMEHLKESHKNFPRADIRIFKEISIVFKTVFTNPGLRWAVGLTVLWFWSRQFVNLYLPGPYFKFLDFHLKTYGMLAAALTFCGGIIAFFSRKLINRPDLKWFAISGLVLIPTCFAFMGFVKNKYGLMGFFLYAIPYGLCTAVTNTLLNRQFMDHARRSTFLGIVDFCVRLTASAVTIWLGKVLADPQRGITYTLLFAALFSIGFALMLFPGVFKYTAENPRTNP